MLRKKWFSLPGNSSDNIDRKETDPHFGSIQGFLSLHVKTQKRRTHATFTALLYVFRLCRNFDMQRHRVKPELGRYVSRYTLVGRY